MRFLEKKLKRNVPMKSNVSKSSRCPRPEKRLHYALQETLSLALPLERQIPFRWAFWLRCSRENWAPHTHLLSACGGGWFTDILLFFFFYFGQVFLKNIYFVCLFRWNIKDARLLASYNSWFMVFGEGEREREFHHPCEIVPNYSGGTWACNYTEEGRCINATRAQRKKSEKRLQMMTFFTSTGQG